MAESPKRPADVSRADASRVGKGGKPAVPTNETARAADSVPVAVGPFTVLPTQFGRYRIDKLLGKGAMGAVYLAHDIQLDRPVALKVARISTAGSAKLIKRMETEAKAAAKIDHPLICKVHDFGEIDGIRFIALQYIEGEDLKSYFSRVGRKREPAEALRLMLQMSRGLVAAHAKGVIHRDLKPENVMLNQNGEPVIMDFGLARRMTGATSAGLTQGMILGTAAYMSPEQAAGKAEGIDHRSDLYALGVMLFEMLTGEWPFTGNAIEVMGQKSVQEAPSPLSLNPGIPPQLAAVCDKLIAKKKEDRYATCAELVAALEAVDLNASVAPAMEVEFEAAPAAFDFLHEPPAAPGWLKPSKAGPSARTPSTINRLLHPLTSWWRDQPPALRWTVLGCSGTVAMLLAGVLFFRNGDALVKVTIDSDDVEVTFQGQTIKLKDGTHEYKITPGVHTLHIKSGGIDFDTEKFTLKQGNNPTVTVELIDSHVVVKQGQRTLTTSIAGETAANRKVVKGVPIDVTSGAKEITSSTTGMKLTLIPAGTFQMGSPVSEADRKPNEGPQHAVHITQPFYLGVNEVTQGQYQIVIGSNPSSFFQVDGQDTTTFPVETVSWFDAIEFCNKLSEKDGLTPYYSLTNPTRERGTIISATVSPVNAGGQSAELTGYCLPTEAEWEYACRARTTTPFHFGSVLNGDKANANGIVPYGTAMKGKFLNRTTTVGSYQPNEFGLFDMHGNVREWCQDMYDESAYASRSGMSADPQVTSSLEESRVLRGGAYYVLSASTRSAVRGGYKPGVPLPTLGFRVMRPASALGTRLAGPWSVTSPKTADDADNETAKALSDYQKACKLADERLVDAFDSEFINVRENSGLKADERQGLIDAIAFEKVMFGMHRTIPFSPRMRAASINYLASIERARKLAIVAQDKLIAQRASTNDGTQDTVTKAGNTLLVPKLVGVWDCTLPGIRFTWRLYSDGSAMPHNSSWILDANNRMVVTNYGPGAPGGGPWIDNCVFDASGMTFVAKNQQGGGYNGKRADP